MIPFGEDKKEAHEKILKILEGNDIIVDDEIDHFNGSSSNFKEALLKLRISFVDESKRKRVRVGGYGAEFGKLIRRSNKERQFMFHSKKALDKEAENRNIEPLANIDALIKELASLTMREEEQHQATSSCRLSNRRRQESKCERIYCGRYVSGGC